MFRAIICVVKIVPDIRPFVVRESDTKKHSIAAIKDGLEEDGVVIYLRVWYFCGDDVVSVTV